MCNHVWKIVNDVRVCLRCGLTMRRGVVIGFDRKLPNILSKKGKGNR